jgi:hypothetical protein
MMDLVKMDTRSLVQCELFGLWLLKRMALRFRRFARDEHCRGSSVIAMVCSWIEMDLEGYKIGEVPIDNSILDSIAPDTETHLSRYTSSALDTVNAASMMLDFLKNRDVSIIKEVSSLARDSVDLLVQETISPDLTGGALENAVENHPLMQEEISLQKYLWTIAGEVAGSGDFFGDLILANAEVEARLAQAAL